MLVPLGHLRTGKSLTLVDDTLVQETVNTLSYKINSTAGSLGSSSAKELGGTQWSQRVSHGIGIADFRKNP